MRKVYLANLIFEDAQKKNWNKDLTFCHTLVFFSTLIWTEGQRGKSKIYSYIHVWIWKVYLVNLIFENAEKKNSNKHSATPFGANNHADVDDDDDVH